MKRILQTANFLLITIAIIGSYAIAFTKDKEIGVFLKDTSIIFTITFPYIIDILFHKKIDSRIKFIYILFVFSAHFLGATVELYNHFEHFDKVTHFISGMVSAVLTPLVLYNMGVYDKGKILFNIIMMILLTLFVASLWEFFEYSTNIIFGNDPQRVMKTGVDDTMQDMIVAFIGSIIVCILYYKDKTKHFFDSIAYGMK